MMSIPDPAVWRDMLHYLRRHHTEMCRHWFEELEPLRLDGGILEIRVANDLQRNYLAKKCTDPFTEAAQATTGALVAVNFTTETTPQSEIDNTDTQPDSSTEKRTPDINITENPFSEIAQKPPGHKSTAKNSVTRYDMGDDEIVLSPDYSFDNFVTGPNNQLAYAASMGVSEKPGKSFNPLFIHGGVGLGKTHLLQAICQTILSKNADATICYLSCDTFMNHFIEAVQNGKMNEFRHRYRHVDVLLIDDIHFLANRDRTQEEFFHTFNTLYQSNKQIILSSDAPPNEIPQLEDRLISRFNWGLVTRIEKPCYETRVAIVTKKAQIRGFDLPEPVACYIANKLDTNIRELEGAVTKVQSLSMLRQTPVCLETAREALGDEDPSSSSPQLTIQNIIDAVTKFYDVKLADLQSKRRHRSITVPRQVCMYLARHRTRYSLEEIGGYFGGRDHTTVMHAVKTTEDRMASEEDFAKQIEILDKQLLVGI